MIKKYKILVLCCVSVTMMQAEFSVRQKNYQFVQALKKDSKQDVINLFDNYFPVNKPLSGNRQDNAQLFLKKYYPHFSGNLDDNSTLQELVDELNQRGTTRTVTVQDTALVNQLRKQITDLERQIAALKAGQGSSSSGSGSSSSSTSGSSSIPIPPPMLSSPSAATGGQLPPPPPPMPGMSGSGLVPPPPPMPGMPGSGLIPPPPMPGGIGLPMPVIPVICKPKPQLLTKKEQLKKYQDEYEKYKQIKTFDQNDERSYKALNRILIKEKELLKSELTSDKNKYLLSLVDNFEKGYKDLQGEAQNAQNELAKFPIKTLLMSANSDLKKALQDFTQYAFLMKDSDQLFDLLEVKDKDLAKTINLIDIKKAIDELFRKNKELQDSFNQQKNNFNEMISRAAGPNSSNLSFTQQIQVIIVLIEDIASGQSIDTAVSEIDIIIGKELIESQQGIHPSSYKSINKNAKPFYVSKFIDIYPLLEKDTPLSDYTASVGFLLQKQEVDFGLYSSLIEESQKLDVVDNEVGLWILAPEVKDPEKNIYLDPTINSVKSGKPSLKIRSTEIVKDKWMLYQFASKPKAFKGNKNSKNVIDYLYGVLMEMVTAKKDMDAVD